MRRALPCLALTGLALAGLLVTTALAQDLRELERQLARAKFPGERLEALDAVAQLYEEGEVGVQVTRAVAGALEDEDFDVRARAVTLLGAGLDRDAACDALVDAAALYRRSWEGFEKEATQEVAKLERAKGLDSVERLHRAAEAIVDHTTQMQGYVDLRTALVTALGRRRDDRMVEAFGELLRAHPLGIDASGDVDDALLTLGTAAAIGHLVASFAAYDDLFRDLDEKRRDLERERPGKPPRGWRGTKAAWEADEEARITRARNLNAGSLQRLQERGMARVTRLQSFAVDHDLPTPPGRPQPVREWKTWLAAAADLLPSTLADD